MDKRRRVIGTYNVERMTAVDLAGVVWEFVHSCGPVRDRNEAQTFAIQLCEQLADKFDEKTSISSSLMETTGYLNVDSRERDVVAMTHLIYRFADVLKEDQTRETEAILRDIEPQCLPDGRRIAWRRTPPGGAWCGITLRGEVDDGSVYSILSAPPVSQFTVMFHAPDGAKSVYLGRELTVSDARRIIDRKHGGYAGSMNEIDGGE
jgi:hypothetical protein